MVQGNGYVMGWDVQMVTCRAVNVGFHPLSGKPMLTEHCDALREQRAGPGDQNQARECSSRKDRFYMEGGLTNNFVNVPLNNFVCML